MRNDGATLEQAPGAREIKGDADSWKVNGVVSGKKVFLLFSGLEGKVRYSAELVAEQENTLKGSYSKGLMKKSPGKEKMLLTKKSDKVVLPVLEGPTATVVVYRNRARFNKGNRPPVWLDGRQLVWMDNGRYFSFKVSPGAHVIQSEWDEAPINIDAGEGETYYIEFKLSKVGWGRAYGMVELVSEEKGQEDLKKLKPLEPKMVLAESIVLMEPIPEK